MTKVYLLTEINTFCDCTLQFVIETTLKMVNCFCQRRFFFQKTVNNWLFKVFMLLFLGISKDKRLIQICQALDEAQTMPLKTFYKTNVALHHSVNGNRTSKLHARCK